MCGSSGMVVIWYDGNSEGRIFDSILFGNGVRQGWNFQKERIF